MTSGGTPMKSKLAFLVLVMVCAGVLAFSAGLAKADAITGDLTFFCRGGCFDTPNGFGYVGTAPTSSSFVYTNGDLTVNATFDNMNWTWDFGSMSQHFWNAFTGVSAYTVIWNAWCLAGSADLPGHCGDNGIGFDFFTVAGCSDPDCTTGDGTLGEQLGGSGTGFSTTNALIVPDSASGHVTANIVSTPEPGILTLLLTGCIFWILREWRNWQTQRT